MPQRSTTMAKFGRVKPKTSDLTAHHNLGVRNRFMSSELKKKILEMIEENVPGHEIARILGIPQRKIYDRCMHLRMQRKLTIKIYEPDPQYDVAQQMWEEGKTSKEIAEYYKCDEKKITGVIERYRKSFGLFPSKYKREKTPDPQYDIAQQMWGEGKTVKEIAAYYNKPVSEIQKIIIEYRNRFDMFKKKYRKNEK